MRDKLRELLYPAMVLSIVASLWAVGYAREAEEDVSLRAPQPAELARMIHHLHAGNAAGGGAAMADTGAASDTP